MSADLYALLELERTAGDEEIRVAIRQQRRIWVRRQSSPEPARRTEAEQRIRDLDQAEKTLLDPAARAAYDRTGRTATGSGSGGGSGSGSSGPRPPQPRPRPNAGPKPRGSGVDTGPGKGTGKSADDLIDRAWTYLEQDNPEAACRTAQSAVDLRSSDGRAWYVLGTASAAAERFDDAAYQFAEAIRLMPDDADPHLGLGEVYLEFRRWRQAVSEFEQALSLRPGDVRARAGRAEAYLQTGRKKEAFAELRSFVKEDPANERAKRALGFGLYDEVFDGLAELPDGHLILSRKQFSLVRRNLKEIRALRLDDAKLDSLAADLQALLDDARKRQKVPTSNLRYYLAVLGLGVIMLFFFNGTASQVAAVAVMLGVIGLYTYRHRPPNWRVRRRAYAKQLNKRGI